MGKKTTGAIAAATFVAGIGTGAGLVATAEKKDRDNKAVSCEQVLPLMAESAKLIGWDESPEKMRHALLRNDDNGCKVFVRGK
jgi:hypothetical protein